MEQRNVYFDHNATTPLHPEVVRTLTESMARFGNPSSMHAYGREARALVEHARETVAAFIGALPEELVFVGSGSEGNNTVLSIMGCQSQHCSCDRDHKTHIVTTAIEHPCIWSVKCLENRGCPQPPRCGPAWKIAWTNCGPVLRNRQAWSR